MSDEAPKRKSLRKPRREPDRRFFFCHVQKTAGTSLFLGLKRVFGPNEIYPNETDGDLIVVAPQLSVPTLVERWEARGDRIRMLTGHFPLCTKDLLGAEFTTLTVLREPVERTLSYLRHHRALTPEDRDKPLEAIYDDPFRFHGLVHNHMVKMFSLTPETMTDGVLTRVEFTRDHLDRAREQLAGVDHVGLQEHFADFWDELREDHGWDLGEMGHANRTRAEDAEDEARLCERIVEDNALDVELYGYAQQLVAERRAARAARSGSA